MSLWDLLLPFGIGILKVATYILIHIIILPEANVSALEDPYYVLNIS
jgi:hypothetical protein